MVRPSTELEFADHCVMVGTFNPVLRTHQSALERARIWATSHGLVYGTVCIDPPLEELVCRNTTAPEIQTLEDRLDLIAQFGPVWLLAIEPREATTAGVEELLACLRSAIRLRGFVTGRQQTFGRGRGGTYETLLHAANRDDLKLLTLDMTGPTAAGVRSLWERGAFSRVIELLALPPKA